MGPVSQLTSAWVDRLVRCRKIIHALQAHTPPGPQLHPHRANLIAIFLT
ncbi:hypothetical protein P3T22_005809 [Paraburkholderia sp. GAS348]